MLHNCQSIMKYLIYLGIIVAAILVGIGIASEIPSRQFTIIPEEEPIKIEKEMVGHRVITAYNAVEEQTDNTPCISASGMNVCKTYKRVCASNEFPFGTLLLINGRVWDVQDRTNSRYNYRIDLLMDDHAEAMEWGSRVLEVNIIIIE